MSTPAEGSILISSTSPLEGSTLTATYSITDADGTSGSVFGIQWQSATGGGGFNDIPGATGAEFTPTQAEVDTRLRVVVSFLDDAGNAEAVASAPTELVGDLVTGTDGDDSLAGGAAGDTLLGLAGNDVLEGREGADLLYGGHGDDTYVIDDFEDLVFELDGEGSDTIRTTLPFYVLEANVENLLFAGGGDFAGTGNELDNSLTGGDGNDLLVDGFGSDALDGGRGADIMAGGPGDDSYVADDLGDSIVEMSDEGLDWVYTTLNEYVLGPELENLSFVGDGDFTGTGNELANEIRGGDRSDTLVGDAGNDLLDGGSGADTMIGGTGNDHYVVDSPDDAVIESPGEGLDTVQTRLGSYTLDTTLDHLTFIGTGDFAGTGNALDNAISGADGNDTLIGGAGNDVLNGGAGMDAMTGGIGNDTYVVDSTSDVVNESVGEGFDIIRTSLSSYTLGANLEHLRFSGIGDFSATGNALNNAISGGAGNDTLIAFEGNDTLNGGAGVDTMLGGAGNDTYVVDNVGDMVVELAGEGGDTVQTTLSNYTLGVNVENLIFSGTGNFAGSGNGLANRLTGGDGDDALTGGAGADTLNGGSGNDVLDGGTGNDVFVFNASFGNDVVQGFDADPAGGQDRLDLRSLGITAASFASDVSIAAAGVDAVITIGADTILLQGVNATSVGSADFLLA